MKKRNYTGINIQFPISRLIVSGEKTIETRTYPLPERLVGQELAIIETPGKSGSFKSRIIGIVIFGQSFKYKNAAEFYKDKPRHRVMPDSIWAWNAAKGKWGWPILKISPLKKEIPLRKRSGIIYAKNIEI